MEIKKYDGDGKLVLFISGEIDHHEAKTAMKRLEVIIEEHMPRDCVLDMSGLTFMDSSGIAVLIRLNKALLQSGGRLTVENPSAQPGKVIDAAGLDRLITIRNTVKESN